MGWLEYQKEHLYWVDGWAESGEEHMYWVDGQAESGEEHLSGLDFAIDYFNGVEPKLDAVALSIGQDQLAKKDQINFASSWLVAITHLPDY